MRPWNSRVSFQSRQSDQRKVKSWLELVAEVEESFGPMPAFANHLQRGIERGTALVVGENDVVQGAALLSRVGRPQRTNWLAVRSACRRRGVGAALLRATLDRWPDGEVEVVTFTADTPAGRPARKLYERFGFACQGRTGDAPDGGPRDLYLLRR